MGKNAHLGQPRPRIPNFCTSRIAQCFIMERGSLRGGLPFPPTSPYHEVFSLFSILGFHRMSCHSQLRMPPAPTVQPARSADNPRNGSIRRYRTQGPQNTSFHTQELWGTFYSRNRFFVLLGLFFLLMDNAIIQ